MNAIRNEVLARVTQNATNLTPGTQFKIIDKGLADQVINVLAKLDCNSVRVATDVVAPT